MKSLNLTNGRVVLVSDEDYEALAKHTWIYDERADGRTAYAYANMRIYGTSVRVFLHNYLLNPPPYYTVDHKNGDGLNNTRENLRIASAKQQADNARPYIKRKATSKYKGVCLDARKDSPNGKRWKVAISSNGKRYSLGYYRTEEEGARAYDAAAREHFGEFAYLNFPTD